MQHMTPTQQSLYEARKARIARIIGAGIEHRPTAPKFVPVVVKRIEPPEESPGFYVAHDVATTRLFALVTEATQFGAWPVKNDPYEPTLREVLAAVSQHYGITMFEMTCSRRPRRLTIPRHVAMFLCRYLTRRSLTHIGRHIGKRDHTTVMHGINKIEEMLKTDVGIQLDLNAIKARLGLPA